MLKKALRILGIVFLVLYAWTMAEAKEQSRIGVIGRTGWLDLGKEYGYEINIVDGKVFDDLQEAQKYRMIIIGDKGSMFSEKQYKNIEKYVEDGGILAILYYYACRYVDINGNGKYDSGKDRRNRNNWIMPKVSGVKNNGIYFLGEIQFQNESFLARGFSKDKRYKLDQSLKAFTKFTAKLEPLKGTEVIASAKLFKCIKKGGKHYTYQGDEVGEGAIFTANKYGKGLCVQSGVYLAYGALNRKCPVCLQLIKNIFSLAGPAGKRETGARELHKEPELEGRGFWLAPFKYFNMKDEAEGRKQIKELMKTAAGNNFNFVNVRAHRGPLALYNSKVLPLKYSNWDVLGAVIEEAHNYGIEVFPVIISDFRHSLRKNGVGPIMESHPGWLTMEREEDCKSFAQYMKDIVMELADNYDIDGICYDDEDGVRNGKNGWRKYFYPAVYKELKQKHPKILSAAFGFDVDTYPGKGNMDIILLVTSPTSVSEYKTFYDRQIKKLKNNSSEKEVIIYTDVHYKAGSGVLEKAQDMIKRVDVNRELDIKGTCIFHYGYIIPFQTEKIWPQLKKTVFREKVLPAHVILRQKRLAANDKKLPLVDIRGGQGALIKADKSEAGKDEDAGNKKPDAQFRILNMDMDFHLVHYEGEKNIKFDFRLKYDVTKPAPVYLTTRKDAGYEWYGWKLGYEPEWRMYNYTRPSMPQLYAREKIDLSVKGIHEVKIPVYESDQIRGGPIKKGINGIVGLYYLFYIMDMKTGRYIDSACLPQRGGIWSNFNSLGGIAGNLVFTIADLKKFSLYLAEFKSDWQTNGFFTVRIKVRDGDGEIFDIPRADIYATIYDKGKEKKVSLLPVFDSNSIAGEVVPQGYFKGRIPAGFQPDTIKISAVVTCLTPGGKKVKTVSGKYGKGHGATEKIEEPLITLAGAEKKLHENSKETRAMCVWKKGIRSPEEMNKFLNKLKAANFNVVIPEMYPFPDGARLRGSSDPELFTCFVKKAHQAGLEVHPYMITMALNPPQMRRYMKKHGENFMLKYAAVKEDGTRENWKDIWACCHRPDFQQEIAKMVADAVKKHHLDGICLDYSRTQISRCYCDYCKEAFRKKFGKKLTEANSYEWKEWQDEGMADVIKTIYTAVKKAEPRAIVSAYCITPQRRGGQRGWKWVNDGILDFAWQGTYWKDTHMRLGYMANELSKTKDKTKYYPCIGGHHRIKTPELWIKELILMRQLGVKGIIAFTSHQFTDEHYRLLKEGPFKNKAVPYFR